MGPALIGELPGLRRYARGLAGSLAAADDLVQDTLERALRNLASLDQRDRLGGWMRTILYRCFLDDVRRRRGIGATVDVADLDNDLALSTPAADHSDRLDFLRALQGVSVEHRQILLMIGVEGLSYREAADELNMPIGTVMSRLARARAHLRAVLSDGLHNGSGARTATVVDLKTRQGL